MHLPLFRLTEARYPIQPRREADAIRDFLLWAGSAGTLDQQVIDITRQVLDRFEAQVRSELRRLPEILASLESERSVDIFPLNDHMLTRSAELAFRDLSLQPLDEIILAAVLARAEELWAAGERDLCFCELDGDLQPWDKYGNPKPPLAELYDRARIWVYGDFELLAPERREDWLATIGAERDGSPAH